MYAPVRAGISLCCITSVVFYLPTHVVLNTLPTGDRDCQFLTCHTDLANQRWPPSANHKHFLNIRPIFSMKADDFRAV